MKKLSLVFVAVLLSLSFFTPIQQASAQQNDSANKNYVSLNAETLSKPFVPMTDKQLDKIRNSNKEYTVELTYEQAVKRTSEITGKSIDEVKRENSNTCSENLISAKTNTLASAGVSTLASTCTWTETSTYHTVKSSTKQLIVILMACRDGSFGWIDTSKKPMLQEFKASSQYFSGTIKVDLESTGYYYVVNGSFYSNTAVTHQGTTGANTVFTATYSVSSTSSFYGSLYTGVKWKQVTP